MELQIRTHDMDAIAEKGVAAHWVYKEKAESGKPNLQEIEPFKWLQKLVGQLKMKARLKSLWKTPNLNCSMTGFFVL